MIAACGLITVNPNYTTFDMGIFVSHILLLRLRLKFTKIKNHLIAPTLRYRCKEATLRNTMVTGRRKEEKPDSINKENIASSFFLRSISLSSMSAPHQTVTICAKRTKKEKKKVKWRRKVRPAHQPNT